MPLLIAACASRPEPYEPQPSLSVAEAKRCIHRALEDQPPGWALAQVDVSDERVTFIQSRSRHVLFLKAGTSEIAGVLYFDSVGKMDITPKGSRAIVRVWDSSGSFRLHVLTPTLDRAHKLLDSIHVMALQARRLSNQRAAGTGPSLIDSDAQPLAGKPVSFGDPLLGDYHALIIGNEKYTALPKLATAIRDAEAIGSVLEHDYGFQVRILRNATRSEVLDALAELRRDLQSSDNLLIYYAGHGIYDETAERGYWVPVDAGSDDLPNWISNATITDLLKSMRAKHVMIMADTCYSGTLTRGIAVPSHPRDPFARLAAKRARTALTSGGLEPVADGGGSGHSAFARAVLSALEQNEGVLDGEGLFAAVRGPVMLNADQTPEYGDIRYAGHEGGDFLFVRDPSTE